jgi:hypothetical protein
MRKLIWRRPSAGVVLGTLALIVAVAGNSGAFAGTKVIVRKGEIAKGAVTAKTLAAGAVTAAAIKSGAVTGTAIALDSVGSGQLAPGSVYGGALGEVTLHSAALSDVDAVAENGTWTLAPAGTALCGSGERILSGGVVFTDAGNHEVGIVITQPFVNGPNQGWVGAITSNSGGTAKAEVQALCLK